MLFRLRLIFACIVGVVGPLLPWTSDPRKYKPTIVDGKDEHTYFMEGGGKLDNYVPDDDDYNDKPVMLYEGAHAGTGRFKVAPDPEKDSSGKDWVMEPWDATLYIDLDGQPGGPKEKVSIKVHPEWAPEACKRFQDLLVTNALDDTRFYRVIKNYIAQFGIPAKPEVAQKWEEKKIADDELKDDMENKRGTLVFAQAGPDTRTTQMFFNMKDNEVLDKMNFVPFAEVVGDGMQVIDRVQDRHGDNPDMVEVQRVGNSYLAQNFPDLSFIERWEYSFPDAETSRRNLKMRSRSEEV